MPVLEHSVAEFIEHWKTHAANVHIHPQPDASPLLELEFATKVFYALDRVGPYAAKSGPARVIVNPTTQTLEMVSVHQESFEVPKISCLSAVGEILEVSQHIVVVRAKMPLVVGVLDDSWKNFKVGDWVKFDGLEPIHGFYLGIQKQ